MNYSGDEVTDGDGAYDPIFNGLLIFGLCDLLTMLS